ncbi:hypothetical protein LOZ80_15700 [Paenibacillus sp. HWE-109]|uniref:hypothetical protein n=1 Tax=Paenibacillus sp. HWE-109 TaxID=1306526 RepID=UPI001EE0190B|nr:hypothetical protein [Paenibacillus sp. HWE-109]UKS30297.1 hypothetical protein LOZ80_15700 [Paenibacillus sp. HWE-109]
MESKIGLLIDLPESKLPGFYAQITKALAGSVALFDHDNEMLIVSNKEQQTAVLAVIKELGIEADLMDLRLLPPDAELTDLFSDYGFTSHAGNDYLYDKLVIFFRFAPGSPQAEVDQAALQMEEHLLVQYQDEENGEVFIADRQLGELMHGIAKAYRCRIEMLS